MTWRFITHAMVYHRTNYGVSLYMSWCIILWLRLSSKMSGYPRFTYAHHVYICIYHHTPHICHHTYLFVSMSRHEGYPPWPGLTQSWDWVSFLPPPYFSFSREWISSLRPWSQIVRIPSNRFLRKVCHPISAYFHLALSYGFGKQI